MQLTATPVWNEWGARMLCRVALVFRPQVWGGRVGLAVATPRQKGERQAYWRVKQAKVKVVARPHPSAQPEEPGAFRGTKQKRKPLGWRALAPCVTSPHPETNRIEAKQLRMCLLSKRELGY